MKGLIKRTLATLCLSGAWGCYCYDELVDPCYPERYNAMARQETNAAFGPQVDNGHVLDQTVWNSHFEAGGDKLTVGGQEHLAYLARRRPYPDPRIFLQTANDVAYDPAAPEKYANARADLNEKRVQSIQRFLNAHLSGRPVTFNVEVHDPAEVGMAAAPVGIAIQKRNLGAQGVMKPFSGGGGGTGGGNNR